MKKRTFLGIDFTPRKEYREEIERLNLLLQQKKSEVEYAFAERNKAFADAADWKQKYEQLLADTPARGKGGKFVRRPKHIRQ